MDTGSYVLLYHASQVIGFIFTIVVIVMCYRALKGKACVPNKDTRAAIESAQRGEVTRFSSAKALMDDLNGHKNRKRTSTETFRDQF